jgi:hypothetical protein
MCVHLYMRGTTKKKKKNVLSEDKVSLVASIYGPGQVGSSRARARAHAAHICIYLVRVYNNNNIIYYMICAVYSGDDDDNIGSAAAACV